MRFFPRSVLLALLILSWAHLTVAQSVWPDAEGKVESKYDRFEDKTTVKLSFLEVVRNQSDRLYLNALAQYETQFSRKPPTRVALNFMSVAVSGYRYEEGDPLDIIADGERFNLGPQRLLGREIVEGKYTMALASLIDYDEFMKIANAKRVEMRLGETEFTLSDAQLEKLRSFARLLHF